MPTEVEEPRTDIEPAAEHDEEGGPVKSFLEHLEDLRWVLIKSLAAVGVGMLICLIAGDKVVSILKWPLTRAKVSFRGTNEVWMVSWGTNVMKTFALTDQQQAQFGSVGDRFKAWQIDLTPN